MVTVNWPQNEARNCLGIGGSPRTGHPDSRLERRLWAGSRRPSNQVMRLLSR